jgi:hypothetical protein
VFTPAILAVAGLALFAIGLMLATNRAIAQRLGGPLWGRPWLWIRLVADDPAVRGRKRVQALGVAIMAFGLTFPGLALEASGQPHLQQFGFLWFLAGFALTCVALLIHALFLMKGPNP